MIKIPKRLKKAIEDNLRGSFEPYKSFDKAPTPEQINQYREILSVAGFGEPTEQVEDIFEQLTDDLYDDFHNCGGMVLNRLKDCQMFWPLLNEEQKEELISLLTDAYITELEN